ncbi:MAG: hypothetical protein QMD09_14145 [Desulfatibacillaceae bacterium]|nr:hypothetical protein [Desulfatibacillaceae bacterium]
MAGCDAARSSHQAIAGQRFFDMGFVKTPGACRRAGYNLPQPVLAHDSFWFLDLYSKKLCGIWLKAKQGDYPDFPQFSRDVARPDSAPDSLHYGNSLVFDGIFVWFVLEGSLWRKMVMPGRDGQAAGNPLENIFNHHALLNLCKAAPLLVRPDSARPQRYLVACLKTHFLVADVSRKDSFNYRLLRWQEDGGKDEMHSAVACGARVFGLSQQGKFFLLNLANGLSGLPADGEEIGPFTMLPGHFCAAPAVAGNHLVFETLNREPLAAYPDSHVRGIASLDSRFFALSGPVSLSRVGQRPEKLSNFFDRAHLPGLTDGISCYFCGDAKKPVIYYSPASQTLAPWERKESAVGAFIPMDSTNAVLWGGCMVLVNPGLFIGWHLEDQSEAFIQGIQGAGSSRENPRLLARPVVCGNILAIVLPDRVVFEALPQNSG